MQQDLLGQAFPPDLDERERAARGEVISMLFEGLAVRGVNNPGGDRAAIAAVLRSVLKHLLSQPAQTPKA